MREQLSSQFLASHSEKQAASTIRTPHIPLMVIYEARRRMNRLPGWIMVVDVSEPDSQPLMRKKAGGTPGS
jgi:hypothetical protein